MNSKCRLSMMFGSLTSLFIIGHLFHVCVCLSWHVTKLASVPEVHVSFGAHTWSTNIVHGQATLVLQNVSIFSCSETVVMSFLYGVPEKAISLPCGKGVTMLWHNTAYIRYINYKRPCSFIFLVMHYNHSLPWTLLLKRVVSHITMVNNVTGDCLIIV